MDDIMTIEELIRDGLKAGEIRLTMTDLDGIPESGRRMIARYTDLQRCLAERGRKAAICLAYLSGSDLEIEIV